MKNLIFFVTLLFVCNSLFSQVGINNTNPQASLDISASNIVTPANTDGVLIPRIANFPAVNPTVTQDGMLVFVTGGGTPTEGFYYWDNGTTAWVGIGGSAGPIKIDDLTDGKSDNDGTNDGSSIFFGIASGQLEDSSDNRNVGIGFNSLYSTVDGQHNTAIGYRTLFSNTTGFENTATGYLSLWQNTTGSSNSAYGNTALFSNTEGIRNSAVGNQALFNNTTGDSNVAIGQASLLANTIGDFNTAVGYRSLVANTTGTQNTALGYRALQLNATGTNNVGLGSNALFNTTAGSFNIGIGENAMQSNRAGSLAVAIGTEAMQYSNDTATAYDNHNIAVGYQALQGSITASNNTGNNNSAIGYQSLQNNSIGSQNTALGYRSLNNNIDGSLNTAVGSASLSANTTGIWNTAVGQAALNANVGGSYNTVLGRGSMSFNSSGNSNVALGVWALNTNASGSFNTVIGTEAATSLTAASNNTIIGRRAMNSFTSGGSNVAVGAAAGYYGSGIQNTYLGTEAGFNPAAPTRDGSVFIGYGAGSSEATSNKLYIENSAADADNALIYGEFDTNIIRTNGELQIGNPTGTGYAMPTIDGTANQVLSTDGSGQVSWVPSGGTTPSIVRANMTGSVSIPIANWVIMPFDSESFDTNAEYDPSTYIFTAANTGYYRVHANYMHSGSGGTPFSIGIFINGTLEVERPQRMLNYNPYPINNSMHLTAGDTVEIQAYNAGAGVMTLNAVGREQQFFFEIERID